VAIAEPRYNAGAHRVSDWLVHRRRLPRETRSYVVRVTGRSVDEWRRMPPDDSALTFVRPLPCRELPAFADLEQAQSQQMQTRRARITREVEEPAIVGRRQIVDRGHEGEGRSAAVRELLGNLRGGRREGRHPQHLAHERRKIA